MRLNECLLVKMDWHDAGWEKRSHGWDGRTECFPVGLLGLGDKLRRIDIFHANFRLPCFGSPRWNFTTLFGLKTFVSLCCFSLVLSSLSMNSNNPPSLLNPQSQAQEAQYLAQKHVENTAVTGVHTFDENMTPEQKRAQAEKQIPAEMLPNKDKEQQPGVMATDVPSLDAQQIRMAAASAERKPAVAMTKASPGSVKPPTSENQVYTTSENQVHRAKSAPPGAFTKMPNYYRSGWTAFSALENPGGSIQLSAAEKPEDPLGDQLNEALYGEWWHNASVLFFTGFFTWLLIKMGGGLASVMIVCAFLGKLCFEFLLLRPLAPSTYTQLATYYQTSVRRFRRNVRDDIQRQLVKHQPDSDFESMNWLNTFLGKWYYGCCVSILDHS